LHGEDEMSGRVFSHEIHCARCFMAMTESVIKLSKGIIAVGHVVLDNFSLEWKKEMSDLLE
jgi:hypothetical protein